VKHGCCLGIGLSAMSTNRKDIYELLKNTMYEDNAVIGEAIGLAIGLVMLGSNNDTILQDMVSFAQFTLHERVLRGLAVGISFIMYGRLEEADQLITSLYQNKNPLLRCSAMYTISMAYCGTSNEIAVNKLLHVANSDISDDVRCAAVTSLGFLFSRTPELCLKTVSIYTKSCNPYVRYGAAMALGIACAGTGLKETIHLLEPMIQDLVNFVRQGALIASSMIFIRPTESTFSNNSYFRTLYANVVIDYNEDDVAKFGAILAQGIIEGGGHNVSIEIQSKSGNCNMLTVIGLMLFTQYQHCICLSHCLTLAFTPKCDIALNTQLETTFKINSVKNDIKPGVNSLCQELAEQRTW